MKIRVGSRDDVDTLIQLFHDSVHRGAAGDYTPAQLFAWAPTVIDKAQWAKKLDSQTVWIAELEGAAIGFVTLDKPDYVDMLYVHPDHLRRGVATRLIAHAQKLAVRLRAKRLRTEASVTARGFFEKHGFQMLEKQIVLRNGQNLTNFRMEKRL